MLDNLIILLLIALLFFGGLGVVVLEVKLCIFLVGILLIALSVTRESKLLMPKYFKLYLIYLLILAFSLLWARSRNSAIGYLVLYIDGGLFWLIFYNFPQQIKKLFLSGLIFLGFVFGGIFIYTQVSGRIDVNAFNLISPVWYDSKHIHLGDYWMICLVFLYYFFMRERIVAKKIQLLVLILAGFYFLIASSTRSALVGLGVGIFYLSYKKFFQKKYKKFSYALIAMLVLVFLWISSSRTTIFSRDYIVQGIVGVFNKPFGVGMGNFYVTSSNVKNQIFGLNQVSSVAHNLIIENVSGVGTLSLVFIIWFFLIIIDQLRQKVNLYNVLFLTLALNFMFDFTYAIPTIFCLWFAFLGLSQAKSMKSSRQHI